MTDTIHSEALIVEDISPTGVKVICDALQTPAHLDWQFVRVSTASEAAELLRRRKFPVCIVDVNRKNGEGVRGCQPILDAKGETPIVIVSSEDDAETIEDFKRAGATAYFCKCAEDWNSLQFAEAVEELMKQAAN